MSTLWQDLRLALRMLRKSPGFSTIAVLTLAIGLGANAAIFSVIDAVLLKPLPYNQPERALIIARNAPANSGLPAGVFPWGGAEFKAFEKKKDEAFTALAAFRSEFFNLAGHERAERIDGAFVTAGFFQAIGREPLLGRGFTADEDRPGHEHVVVLSYDVWQRDFGGDANIIGRAITLNSASYTVIGVMPRGFTFPNGAELPANFSIPSRTDIWTPLALPEKPRGPAYLLFVARMRPGISVSQVRAVLALRGAELEKEFPGGEGWFSSAVVLLPDQIVGTTRPALWILWGAVGILLAIACANLASLLVVRCAGRRREFSLRLALGASRKSLMRQLATEGALLSLIGGALGLVIAYGLVHAIQALETSSVPRLAAASLNARVFGFSVVLSLAVGILLGWAAALDAGRAPINESLRESAISAGMGKRVSRIHSVVVVAEIALTIVLLTSAGLLGRSFRALATVDTGFHSHSALTFELTLPPAKYNSYDAQVAFYRGAMERLNRAPGVAAAALVTPLPLSGNDESTVFHVEGDGLAFMSPKLPMAEYTVVSANYFDALGIPVLEGRSISDADTLQSLPVTVVNESFAKKTFPNGDALGHKVMLGSPVYPAMTVVGVVADTKVLNLRDRAPMGMYVPYSQHPYPSLETTQVVVRSAGPPLAAAGSVRDAIRELDPEQPVAKMRTMDLLVADALTSERFLLFMIGQFASMALILSAIGIYGVLAYATSQRTHEIGIRMALGAQRANVFGLVIGQGFALTIAGIVLGLAGAWSATRVLGSVLYGVSATDPWTFAVVAAVLGGVAMLACYVPARRAMRVDPIVALRYE